MHTRRSPENLHPVFGSKIAIEGSGQITIQFTTRGISPSKEKITLSFVGGVQMNESNYSHNRDISETIEELTSSNVKVRVVVAEKLMQIGAGARGASLPLVRACNDTNDQMHQSIWVLSKTTVHPTRTMFN